MKATAAELTDVERALFGFDVDADGAAADVRFALFLAHASPVAGLVTDGHLTREQAASKLGQRASELELGAVVDVPAVVDSYVRSSGAGTHAAVALDLEDEGTWEAWAASYACGEPKPDAKAVRELRSPKVAEIRPGVRGTGSFLSVMITQRSLVRIAELCPAGQQWQSFVLAVQELEESRQLGAELDEARRTIRRLRTQVAELEGD